MHSYFSSDALSNDLVTLNVFLILKLAICAVDVVRGMVFHKHILLLNEEQAHKQQVDVLCSDWTT